MQSMLAMDWVAAIARYTLAGDSEFYFRSFVEKLR